MNHDKMMKRDEVAAVPVSNLLCHLEHFPAGWVKHFILPHCSLGWCVLALGHGGVDARLSETAVTVNFDLGMLKAVAKPSKSLQLEVNLYTKQ